MLGCPPSQVVAAEPVDASAMLTNADAIAGRVALVKRGAVPLRQKVRACPGMAVGWLVGWLVLVVGRAVHSPDAPRAGGCWWSLFW